MNKDLVRFILILLVSSSAFTNSKYEYIQYLKNYELLCGISKLVENKNINIEECSFNVVIPSPYYLRKSIFSKKNTTVYPTKIEFGIIRDFSESIVKYDSKFKLQLYKKSELVYETEVNLGQDMSSWTCDFTRFEIPKDLCGEELLCVIKTIKNDLPPLYDSFFFYISEPTTK